MIKLLADMEKNMEEEYMPGWMQFFCGTRKRKLLTSISIFAVVAALIATFAVSFVLIMGVYCFRICQTY